MSGSVASIIGAAATVVGGVVSAAQASESASQQKSAADKQLEQAKKDSALQAEQFAKQNQKQANIEGLLEGNSSDLNPTSLTGAQGVQVDPSTLGKNSLLGG